MFLCPCAHLQQGPWQNRSRRLPVRLQQVLLPLQPHRQPRPACQIRGYVVRCGCVQLMLPGACACDSVVLPLVIGLFSAHLGKALQSRRKSCPGILWPLGGEHRRALLPRAWRIFMQGTITRHLPTLSLLLCAVRSCAHGSLEVRAKRKTVCEEKN